MKKIIYTVLFTLITLSSFAQQKVHSHNDYAQKRPFFEAYENKVDQIEADIFLVGDSLIVAHSKKGIDPTHTLNKLYLNPIASLFKQYKNRVSVDKKYTFSLMIDVKENWNTVYPVLKREIEKYGDVFNRGKDKYAIQIVISGNRPADSTFHTYPEWLFFDGLPNISYAKRDLARVSMISDNFATYSKWRGNGYLPKDDQQKLEDIIKQARRLKKPVRFWGAPDTEDSWSMQLSIGVDIINTDNVQRVKHAIKDFKVKK
ncbi:MAG: glycerophosphodiester phosphodiesterase [Pedobacter sp.]|nr:MAG: glycerophosphodiester phosphodiesterase [Pedobacter sp.]